MEAGLLVILALRLIIPLSILRWPLWGTVASAVLDAIDVPLLNLMGVGSFSEYPRADKALDIYYLSFAFIKSLKWGFLAKRTSIALFICRLFGVIAFEITNIQLFLLFFPNLFELWFLFWAARNRFFRKFTLTKKKLAIILIILLIPKLIQEIILHYPLPTLWDWINANFEFFTKIE
ncbi:MAG: hypothetical protein GY861_08970 [bacterium]|nr:hypothetical protein [bacterium]